MSDYEQNPINGSQPPQGDSQSNTGYTPYQQPGTYYTPPQPEQPQTPPTGDNGTTYHYAYHSGNQPGAAYNGQQAGAADHTAQAQPTGQTHRAAGAGQAGKKEEQKDHYHRGERAGGVCGDRRYRHCTGSHWRTLRG